MTPDGLMVGCASYCDMCEGKTVTIEQDGENLIFVTNITPLSVAWYLNNVLISNENTIVPDIYTFGTYRIEVMDAFCTVSSEYQYIDDP